MSIDRRSFLLLMAFMACASAAAAKDGDSGSGGGDDGGDDGGDSDNSGPGNSNDDNDDGDDDDDRDDDRDDDDRAIDQDSALKAVRDGEIIPLNKAIGIVKRRNPGKIIDVSLKRRSFSDVYSFKIKNSAGRVVTLRMNARTGAILGF